MDKGISKEAAKILQRFEEAKRQRQTKDAKWRELDAFDRGEQWNLGDVKIPAWVPKPVTNYVHLVKTTKRAALAIENPAAMILGQSPEDHLKAKELQKVVDFVWEQIKARKVVRECLDTAKLLGTGIAKVYYDAENDTVKGGKGGKYTGEIKVRQIDPANFYPDPNAFTLEDCEYIHLVYRRPLKWVEERFGVKGLKPTERSHNEQGEIYQRAYSSERKDKIVDFHEHYEKVPNPEDVGGYTYYVTYMAGDKIVRERQPLKPNCYPFAILYDFPQRQDFWGQSTCEIILDNQKLINKVESIMALIGSLLQNPQKIVHKQSGISPEEVAKYGSAPGHVWLSNTQPDQAMRWSDPPQIPQALFNLAEQARLNIREITGLTEAYMGQTVGSLQTSTGVNSLIERSTMRDRDQMYDLELFVEQLTHIIIQFIIEYYSETRIARILGDNNEPEFFEFKGTDYRDVAYDIKVDVSAKAPVTKVRKQEELDKLLNIQGQYQFSPAIITPQEYVEESDFIDSEKFVERMNMEEIRSAEAIMTETLQMMTEAQQQGLPQEEIAQMAQAMLLQRFEQKQKGIGSATSENTGDMQLRQGQATGVV